MTLFALYVLALLDGLLCGIRTSMGRCPLIRKHAYYARAIVRGVIGAQLFSMIALAALLTVFALSSDRDFLRRDLELTAGRMLRVFVPYLVILNLALRLVPSNDVRSATSVLMLGPLTAIRPLVMVVGVFYGIAGGSTIGTRILGILVLALMLSLEYVLNRRATRAQQRQIRELV
jgi:hypothetical protein